MNNLSSYCGLVDAEIRASDKDLPVHVPIALYVHLIWIMADLLQQSMCKV